MAVKKRSWKAIKQTEIDFIIWVLKDKIGIEEVSDSGMAHLQNLSKKDRWKMIRTLLS